MTNGNIWPLLLSGVVGILLGGLVQVAVSRYVAFKEGQSIASAIRAEIETLLRAWETAKFPENIDRNIKRLESSRGLAAASDIFVFTVNPKAFQVFDSLCHKIGLLGDLSAEIVGFYGQGKALLTILITLRVVEDRLLDGKASYQRAALLDQTRHADRLYRDFREAGDKVIPVLGAYERRWWLLFTLWSWLTHWFRG
jgi:hypothetical protein